MSKSFYKLYTAKAPVNIALIKYWGKKDERLKIPLNDSLSGTLDIDDMCATTSVAISDAFHEDAFWLNGEKQVLETSSQVSIMINTFRELTRLDEDLKQKCKIHIVSRNNFPTAAGLASSAAGYACLAYVLGQVYEVTDPTLLSRIARRASGSACRSLFGGFVMWIRGTSNETSKAEQIVSHDHWPEMKVIICVVNDGKKEISSSQGMLNSCKTSELLEYRANHIVPQRVSKLKEAILGRDFDTFAEITMKDSNQFHAICLDSHPPIFYLNETSQQIIKICTLVNSYYGKNVSAYTFDAGPNACIYLLEDHVSLFIQILMKFFPSKESNDGKLEVKGKPVGKVDQSVLDLIYHHIVKTGLRGIHGGISYLINSSIGDGPKIIDNVIEDKNLVIQ